MIVIPTYNERNNIETLVRRIRAAVGSEGIFFVDDNSPDGTADEIRRVKTQDPHVHLAVRPGKDGYASACRLAMQKIVADGLDDHIIQFDADLSHPPEALPTMIALLQDYPVVIGSRYIRGGKTVNWDLRRRILSFGGNLYARVLTGIPVHDVTSGFIGYRTDVLAAHDLSALRSEGYAFLMEMKYLLHRSGVRFCEFPITFTEREAGKSKFGAAIMLEGIGCPLRIFGRRLRGG